MYPDFFCRISTHIIVRLTVTGPQPNLSSKVRTAYFEKLTRIRCECAFWYSACYTAATRGLLTRRWVDNERESGTFL